ncbi:MAG: hypothetical protein ACRDJO_00205, partial [Actinomycetota bacterium]
EPVSAAGLLAAEMARGRADALHQPAILHLQRRAGNAAVASALQRFAPSSGRPSSGALAGGTQLAVLSMRFAGIPVESPIVAEREVTPPGEVPGRFAGFADEAEAQRLARLVPNVTAVAGDPGGRYHVYDTKWPPLSGVSDGFAIMPVAGHGLKVIRWVNLVPPPPEQSWGFRVNQAHQLFRRHQVGGEAEVRDAAEKLFRSLTGEAMAVGTEAVHVVRGDEPVPGRYNFDLGIANAAKAHGGVTGSVPTTLEGLLPEPTLTLGPLAFDERSPLATFATVQHEAAHVDHATTAIAWVRRWREAMQARRPPIPFADWLEGRRSRGRIPQLDFDIVKEQTDKGGGAANTECLGYLAGFTASFHLMRPELDGLVLFKPLLEIALEWDEANHAVHAEVKAKLQAYVADVLDDEHRDRFRSYARAQDGAAPADAQGKTFYAAIARF